MSKLILFILVFVVSSCGKNAYLVKSDTKGALAVVVDDTANPDEGVEDDGSEDEDSENEDSEDEDSSDEGSGDEGSEDEGSEDEGSGDEGSSDDGSSDDQATSDISCKDDTNTVLDNLKGQWTSGCQNHIDGHSLISSVKINEQSQYVLNYQLFKGEKCNSPEAQVTYDYDIKFDGCHKDSSLFKVYLVSKSTVFMPQSNNYTNYLKRRSECGINSWVKGKAFNVTGETCKFLLSTDPFHDRYRADGEVVHTVLKVKFKDNYMHLADWTSNSGDTEEERITETKETAEYILRKI